MMRNETQLIELARTGDEAAFRQLVEAHSREIFRLAFRLTGDHAVADDVVQESFLKAYRALAKFDGRSRFGTWLYRITANCAMDQMRRKQRDAARYRPLEEATPQLLPASAEPGPERRARSSEISSRIEAALAELSPAERTAFVLRHFEDQSIAEISRTLDAGVSATKHAVFRAVKKLRQELGPLWEKGYA